MFPHLHVHSCFSLHDGASRPEELVATAKWAGMDAIALTDTNALYAAVPFYQAAREAGVRPIFGAEIREDRGAETPRPQSSPAEGPRPQASAVVLARDREGFAELCRLITARQIHEPFSLRGALGERWEHVAVLTADVPLLEQLAAMGRTDGLYVELAGWRQRGELDDLAELATRLRLPVVATNDVHFAAPHQHRIYTLLRAIDEHTSVSALPRGSAAPAEAWLKCPSDMARLFARWPAALRNAERIADECRVELELGHPRMPRFAVPDGETAFSHLWKLAFEGARRRYRPVTPAVVKRLEYELDVIHTLGFSDYFLIVWDIVRYARERGIPTVGRGSAADSLVSYVLGFTDVDPIRYDLYFERFLNLERSDPPDVDIDLCWRRRDEVIDYVYRKYGSERVAMICTFNTFGLRSAMRDVARAWGLPPSEVGEIASRLPHGRVAWVAEAAEEVPEYRGLRVDREPLRSILEVARAIDGFPRHLSVHAGGIVIAPTPLTDFVPLQWATKGVVITQYDMHPIENMGLLKIDLLGQRGLSVIADTVKAVEANRGIRVELSTQPWEDDEPTKHLLRTGQTIGCFQIESPGIRAVLQKLRADHFEIVTAASSVIRPGPSDSGMLRAFIRRYTGREPPEYLHPSLEPILRETFGVMIYQEDILKVARAIGGMSLGEADALRRSMSKKRGYEGIAAQKQRFLRGARAKGISDNVAVEVWRQVESFAGYAFCKAHSASYAVLSMQATYLKAHWPAEFLAAVLTNQGGFYSAPVYLHEARRLGVRILLPDVNRSVREFAAERVGDAWGLRIGLMQVKGLTERAIEALLAARKLAPFSSLGELLSRVAMSEKEAEALILCGAMDGFGRIRPELIWQLQVLARAASHQASGLKPQAPALLGQPLADMGENAPALDDYPPEQKLQHECEVLGMGASAHPMESYREEDVLRDAVPAAELCRHAGRRVKVAGIPVSVKGTSTRGKGERMKFITLEDASGTCEVVLFPRVYRQWGHVLASGGPYLVEGRVNSNDGAWTVVAERVSRLE